MPMIRLTRDSDVGAVFRRMTFYVDGVPVARLRPGQTALIDLAAGTHMVEARMDWLRSAPRRLDLEAESSVALTGALTDHSATFTSFFVHPRSAIDLRLS